MNGDAGKAARDREAERKEWERVRSWSSPGKLDDPPVSDFDRERKDRVKANKAIAAPIVAELRRAGVPLETLGELANVRLVYPAAAPVLLAHLGRTYPQDVQEAVLRALAHPYGAAIFQRLRELVGEQAKTLSEDEKFLFGLALTANATKDHADDIMAMISEPSLGTARISLVLKAARWKDPRITQAVVQLFREGSLPWVAIRGLRLAKVWELQDEVEPYLRHEKADFREEARAYFRARDKALDSPRRV